MIKVKKLEWNQSGHAAVIDGCEYTVNQSFAGNWKCLYWCGEEKEPLYPETSDVGVSSHPFRTESEAKDAAQAHWEAMILGCLEEV